MQIGELSRKTGVSIRSLRYYEEKQLISPTRLDNGYRVYSEIDVERVKAVQFFLDLGLKIEEIYPILTCGSLQPVDHTSDCATSAIALYTEKLAKTREQIINLQRAEAELVAILGFWTKVKERSEGGDRL